jgi:ribosomal protein S18 acetylase RimI-like enzyme
MEVTARQAEAADLPVLVSLYGQLAEEMTSLHPMWPLADGLPEPIDISFSDALADQDTIVYLGMIDGYPLGFLLARVEDLLPQAKGERVGSIRMVFVDADAREVGIGESMREMALGELRARGLKRFDAHVLPGHRLVKNFFEAGGFSARSIVMHHGD